MVGYSIYTKDFTLPVFNLFSPRDIANQHYKTTESPFSAWEFNISHYLLAPVTAKLKWTENNK
jgi:hypothetical protein